jgi:hypothetical protein
MPMSTVRTWTLSNAPSGEDGVEFHPAAFDGPDLNGYETVTVLEAAPVLDLLERIVETEGLEGLPTAYALLREHGRLDDTQGDES